MLMMMMMIVCTILCFARRGAGAASGCRMVCGCSCSSCAALELLTLCAILASCSCCSSRRLVIELHKIIIESLDLQLLGSAQDLRLLALGHRGLPRIHVLQQGGNLESLDSRQYDATLILRHILQYGLKVWRVRCQHYAMRLELFIIHDQGAVHIAAHLVQGMQNLHQIRLMIIPAQAIRLPLAAGHLWRLCLLRRTAHVALAEAVAATPLMVLVLAVTSTRLPMMLMMMMMGMQHRMLLLLLAVAAVTLLVERGRRLRLLVRCGVAAAVVGAVQAAGERGAQQGGRV